MMIISIDGINNSAINTVLMVGLTSNPKFASAPGNTLIEASVTGLKLDSVVVGSQITAVDKSILLEYIGDVPATELWKIERGLRLVQGL